MKPNFRKGVGWRKPKGIHSKVRLSKKGNVGLFKMGMSKGKIKKVRLIHNIKELKGNKEVIIARIGLKKKKRVLEEAEKNGIKILNIKNPEEFLKKIEEKLKKKKKDEKEEKNGKKENEKLDEKIKKEEKEK